jgi:hypothetical protein
MAIPVVKENQKLVNVKKIGDEIHEVISRSFNKSNEDLNKFFVQGQNIKNITLTNKNIFIDITLSLNTCNCILKFFASDSDRLVVKLVRSDGALRTTIDLDVEELDKDTYKIVVQSGGIASDRSVLDIKIISKQKTSDFWYELID